MRDHSLHYMLDAHHTPIPVEDVLVWAAWFEDSAQRIVAQTTVEPYWVSTVFLGLDHNWSDDGPPTLFETMVFANNGDRGDLDCRRYATWDEAVAGHQITVALVRETVAHGVGKEHE